MPTRKKDSPDDLTAAYLAGYERGRDSMSEELHRQAEMNGLLITENAELREELRRWALLREKMLEGKTDE